MPLELFQLPVTYFAKWWYLFEGLSDVQKYIFRYKPDTIEWAVDFGLLRIHRLARELRLKKKVVSAARRRPPSCFQRVRRDMQAVVGGEAPTSEGPAVGPRGPPPRGPSPLQTRGPLPINLYSEARFGVRSQMPTIRSCCVARAVSASLFKVHAR